jgi:hypothetical protein
LGDGGTILVRALTPEVPDDDDGPILAGRHTEQFRDRVVDASQTMQEMLAPVSTLSRAMLEQFKESRPDSVEVEFGVELSAETGVVLASVSGAFHLQVKLTWSVKDDQH